MAPGRYEMMNGFMPHGMCYQWQPGVLALQVMSDGLIALAYLSISCTLFHFVRRRIDLRHKWIFLSFAVFIVACGVTHAIEVLTIWVPAYWLSGGVKMVTALASVSTAILLIRHFPDALRLPTPSAMQSARLDVEREVGERIRAQEDLRQAADTAGLGFWTFDVPTGVLHWDESMFRLHGILTSQVGEPEALRENRRQLQKQVRTEQAAEDATRGGLVYDLESDTVNRDGVVRHLKAVGRITRDEQGRAIRMLGVTFDITERKRANEQFRLAIEAAPTGMLLTSLSGSIVLVNKQIEKLFGYPRSELLGRPIEILLPERFRAVVPDFRRRLFDMPETQAGDLHGQRQDGSEVPVEMGFNPLLTSEGELVLCSIVDLSHRLELDRIRNEFISTVSHELRTPLTSIRGSLGLVQSGAMGALPEQAAAMVTIAYKNSGRLVRIINDILDIGTIEAGKLTLNLGVVALEELLQQAIEGNAAFAQKCEVRFLLEPVSPNDRVRADPDRLMQVIANLLSNAVKFSPAGADVFIRVEPGATTMRIEVEDSGAGIAETFRPRVFEKFAQADASATRRFEGTGLGLSISRMLVEAMGGIIGFDSVVDEGTVFYVELPRMDTVPTMFGSQLSETAAYKLLLTLPRSEERSTSVVVPHVLYIEDDEDLISVMRAALAGKVEIVSARNWRDAERLLHEEEFALVILDKMLPDGNGITLPDRIALHAGHQVPIIILSATDVPADTYLKVAAVLIKSQVSAAQVATTILSYLGVTGP